jgi:hypothetical protein
VITNEISAYGESESRDSFFSAECVGIQEVLQAESVVVYSCDFAALSFNRLNGIFGCS